MNARRAVSLATLVLLANGCGADSASSVGATQSAIVDGERSDAEDDAVVKVIAGEALCSGSLVAPNVVLTALHCVAHYNTNGMFACDSKGVLVTSSPPDGEIGAPITPASIEVHLGALPDATPDAYGAKVFGSGSGVICRNDLAFVVLDRELDAPIAPMRLTRETVRKETMRVVGYGLTEMAASIGRYRRTAVQVTDVGTNGTNAGSGNAAPNTLVLGPGACQGDSGGPAISEETGAIAGVYSLSAGISCQYDQIRNVYTQLAPFAALAGKAFDYAGKEPIVEVSGNAGAGGDTGSGAPSGGDSATGGAIATGGDSVGSGGKLATGGAVAQSGNASGGTTGEGSGSRRDSSCAFSLGGTRSGVSHLILAVLALASALRRRSVRRAMGAVEKPSEPIALG